MWQTCQIYMQQSARILFNKKDKKLDMLLAYMCLQGFFDERKYTFFPVKLMHHCDMQIHT